MDRIRIAATIAMGLLISPVPVLAANVASKQKPIGTWTCTHMEPGYQTTRVLQFVDARLIETDGLGRKHLVPDAAISPEIVAWNDSPGQEFEFDPVGATLTERDADLGTVMNYVCRKG